MEYRAKLYEYLKNRMSAIAPNLTIMVGELVGARLISHAGSLLNLAKQPASTVQILGAEKALFRALKTKHDTPKYGLIYHASLVGQSAPKHKGKISRVLAAKAALAIRVDALGESSEPTVGLEGRQKVEARLRSLEGGYRAQEAGGAATRSRTEAYKPEDHTGVAASGGRTAGYNAAADVMLDDEPAAAADGSAKKAKKEKKEKKKSKKRAREEDEEEEDKVEQEAPAPKKAKKAKKAKSPSNGSAAVAVAVEDGAPKKDKKAKKEKKAKKAKKAD